MKKILGILVLTIFWSCDKIEDPLKPPVFTCGDCQAAENDAFITTPNVIIEEFTGHTCNNCPDAAAEAKSLMQSHPGQVFTLGIHAGGFSIPQPPDYPTDFRTTEGDELFQFANPAGVPVGLVNRLNFGTPFFNVPYRKWGEETEAILQSGSARFGLLVEASVDPSNRELCLSTKFKALEDLTNTSLRWCAFISENKIIAPQKMPDNSKNPTYEHNHVLRASINGTFGSDILDFTGAINEVACETRSYLMSDDWVIENCEVVVYVYENETDSREVLQVVAVEL